MSYSSIHSFFDSLTSFFIAELLARIGVIHIDNPDTIQHIRAVHHELFLEGQTVRAVRQFHILRDVHKLLLDIRAPEHLPPRPRSPAVLLEPLSLRRVLVVAGRIIECTICVAVPDYFLGDGQAHRWHPHHSDGLTNEPVLIHPQILHFLALRKVWTVLPASRHYSHCGVNLLVYAENDD